MIKASTKMYTTRDTKLVEISNHISGELRELLFT
jgi:hypothetical protein